MQNFKRNDRGGFRGNGDNGGFKGGFRGGRGDNRGGDRGERGPVTMHSAICSSCGKPCEVPFRPTGEKPVYCRDCFAGRSAMGGERSQRKDPRTFSANVSNNSQTNSNSQNNSNNYELKKQVEAMNVKLDKLLNVVHSLSQNISISKAVSDISSPNQVKIEKVNQKAEIKKAPKVFVKAKKISSKKKQ